jgi:hypothetical protein
MVDSRAAGESRVASGAHQAGVWLYLYQQKEGNSMPPTPHKKHDCWKLRSAGSCCCCCFQAAAGQCWGPLPSAAAAECCLNLINCGREVGVVLSAALITVRGGCGRANASSTEMTGRNVEVWAKGNAACKHLHIGRSTKLSMLRSDDLGTART